MYKKPSKQKQARRLIAIYTLMICAIVALVSLLVFIMLGYRFDSDGQRIEQTGLVQFDSTPGGATVEIDKKRLARRTNTKSVVSPHTHEFAIWRTGYETWWKQLHIEAGTVTWLDYARLVPKERANESVHQFENLDDIAFAPFGRFALAHPKESLPEFQLYDLRNPNEIKQTPFTIPAELLTGQDDADGGHTYEIDEWDQGGRYVLVKHTYKEQTEWLMVDREDEKNTKNISTIVNLPIADAQISGSSGNAVYVLTEETVRLVDLSDGTLSRAYASRVKEFSLYGSDVITYIGATADDTPERVMGIVRKNDTAPHIVKTIPAGDATPLGIATARYYNKNYIATSVGTQVEIIAGEYPTKDKELSESMNSYASFTTVEPARWLQMSGNGRFVVAQNENGFMSYDLERDTVSQPIRFTEPVTTKLPWLDSYNVWTTEDGQLTMQEFDGANKHHIATADGKYEASFDQNGGYLYSIGTVDGGYQLQRVRMILEN